MATSGSSVSTDEVHSWAEAFAQLQHRFAPHFKRVETKRHAVDYWRGLLSSVERKNGWQIAEQVGDATPYGIQHLLGRSVWEADGVRDELVAYIVERLGHLSAVLVVDETAFLKKGTWDWTPSREYILAWSHWRRMHQAIAKYFHDQRRRLASPPDL